MATVLYVATSNSDLINQQYIMYESPKAIHFLATNNGEEVITESALETRWTVAEACGDINMLDLSEGEFQAIARACDKVNKILSSVSAGFRISLGN